MRVFSTGEARERYSAMAKPKAQVICLGFCV
jgi:hypothetical protein